MAGIQLRLQKELFAPNDEQLMAMAHCFKSQVSSAASKKKEIFLCVLNLLHIIYSIRFHAVLLLGSVNDYVSLFILVLTPCLNMHSFYANFSFVPIFSIKGGMKLS